MVFEGCCKIVKGFEGSCGECGSLKKKKITVLLVFH